MTDRTMSAAVQTRPAARPARARSNLPGYALLAPAALVIVFLVVIPMLITARDSFAVNDPLTGQMSGFTGENYVQLLGSAYAKTMGYSLGMALLNAVVCLVVGYLVAYSISRSPAARQPVLLLLVVIPFLTDFLVRTFSWINLLSAGGPVVTALNALGLHVDSLVPSQAAVVLSLLYAFLPVAVFPIYASMRVIDPSMQEAASDLGAGWWQVQRRVYLPLSAPGLASAAILTFVPTLGVFVIPILLGGGKQLLVGNLIVTLYTEFQNQPLGAALSMVVLVLMLVSIGIAGLIARLSSRRSR